MSDCSRTVDDVRTFLQSSKGFDPQQMMRFYDSWAETYEQDHNLMSYRAPHLAVDFLSKNFSGSPAEAQVLDVTCGSGWVAKLMVKLGFRHFVGVDGSKGMLEQAAKTGLYQDLKLALLGPEPLPAPTGVFDVVIIVGGLRAEFAPVSVVRELCQAAKLGGYICMSRVDPKSESGNNYKVSLEKELQLMEEEGLWTHVDTKEMDKYMMTVHNNHNNNNKNEQYFDGTMYLYRKSLN
ncbi:methyltransferase-like protein 27 isoform X1 [Epinephelus lanceolatus]|uniref:methyltransferase-like protein 27 isoform X1 n=1 Tax=Epinephelus lanceolatus TaxID=310571 RepID=UPI00144680E6|nr:methyltransferase-like protein 27 isoform X1 [Epinephelus lanceolatus]XP_033495685.1 methyltransferase-like protein 27 isoform X1 [Epinephelus lanceolatus]XP_033495686.1 methyltransferase-like protein 27 isoform X1 [Epinephelus lanceolatus]